MMPTVNVVERAAPLPPLAWAGIAAAAASIGAAVFSVVLNWAPAQQYADFVVGYLAWTNRSKAADLWSVPLALAAAMVAAFALQRMAQAVRERGGGDALHGFASQLLLCSAPAAYAASFLFYRLTTEVAPIHLSVACVLVFAATVGLGMRRGRVDPETAGYAVLGLLLIALLPIEWAVLRDRWSRGVAGGVDVGRIATALFVIGAAGLAGISAFRPQLVSRFVPYAIAIGGAGLPLLYLLLYPAHFTGPGDEVFGYPATSALKVAVGAVAAWAWWDASRRVLRARPLSAADPAAVLSPVAFFALVIALRYGQTVTPEVSPDDFHFGEHLLGWWTTLKYHAVPFIDYVSVHGLLEDDLAGYLSSLFFDGTAATIGESERLAHAGLALLTFVAMLRTTRSLPLAFAAALMLGGRSAWFVLAALFCLAAAPSLQDRPARWLAMWLVAAPVVLLAVPAQAVLALAATAPLALYAAYRWWASGEARLRSWPVGIVAALVLVAVASPLGAMLFGALRFLVEFGPVNQIAYALPWDGSFRADPHATFMAEILRMSWIAIPVIAATLIAFFPRASARWPRVAAVALPALLFSIAMIPYTMGRIDAESISRPGVVAILGWSVLVPLMVWAAVGGRAVPALVLVIALGTGALGANPSLTRLAQAGVARPLPADPHKAVAAGLAPMGTGITDDAHRARLLKLKSLLDALLPPGQPYLDVTGNTANHFYLQRPPVLRVPAPYNLVPAREQRRAVESLLPAPPSVALIKAGNNEFDGGPLALRSPLVFRFMLDTYEPYEQEGIVLGRLRDASRATAPRSEAELALLDRTYTTRDLSWIPAAWGGALGSLARKMDPVAASLDGSPHTLHDLVAGEDGSLRVTGGDPFIAYDVSASGIVPAQAGLLKFDFTCKRHLPGSTPIPAIPRLQVFFWGDGKSGPTESTSLYFNGADGTMIVPLDAYPRYLDLANLSGVRIDLDNADACAAFTVRNVGLFQRHTVLDYARAAAHPRRP